MGGVEIDFCVVIDWGYCFDLVGVGFDDESFVVDVFEVFGVDVLFVVFVFGIDNDCGGV